MKEPQTVTSRRSSLDCTAGSLMSPLATRATRPDGARFGDYCRPLACARSRRRTLTESVAACQASGSMRRLVHAEDLAHLFDDFLGRDRLGQVVIAAGGARALCV